MHVFLCLTLHFCLVANCCTCKQFVAGLFHIQVTFNLVWTKQTKMINFCFLHVNPEEMTQNHVDSHSGNFGDVVVTRTHCGITWSCKSSSFSCCGWLKEKYLTVSRNNQDRSFTHTLQKSEISAHGNPKNDVSWRFCPIHLLTEADSNWYHVCWRGQQIGRKLNELGMHVLGRAVEPFC